MDRTAAIIVICLGCVLVLGNAGLCAQTPAAEPVLRLEALVPELLEQNPELQGLRKKYEALLTRPSQEGALPDPRITVGWISAGYPFPGAGLGAEPTANIGVQVAQELPYPGKRSLKTGVARKEAEGEAQMYRARQLSLISRMKMAFFDLRFNYEALDILRRNQTLLQQIAQAAEARYSVGRGMQTDLIRSQVELAQLQNRMVPFEQKKSVAEAEINLLLGRPPDGQMGRPEPAAELPPLEPLESLHRRASLDSPMLRAQRSSIEGRQLGVQLARRDYYPDLDLMGGYYNQGGLKDMWEFKVQLTIPLYFARKQRPALEESVLRLSEAEQTYRTTERLILYQLRERYAAAEAARKLLEGFSRRIHPQLQFALESSLSAYSTGGVDFLTVLSNVTSILENEMNSAVQRAEYLKALAALDELAVRAAADREGRP